MNPKKFLIAIGLIAFTLGAYRFTSGQLKEPAEIKKTNSVKLISPIEFGNLVGNIDVFLLDVHTPEQTHIPGTDAFIPFDQIQNNLSNLPSDKSTPILVYCRSGSMSAQASQEIAALGYTSVYDLDGGTDAYKESHVSVSLTPDTQSLGDVVYGEISTTSFTLTNYSPLPLKITRVSTSCGCTKATAVQAEVDGYSTTTIDVTFDPAVHKDDTDIGQLTRTIYVETDNPNFQDLEVNFTANVIKE
ncbi:hypothetical protein COY48_01505 [Candidatus Collierbacteria bacterium CG_4_10_14_0_8_um_filter_43_86]|uniref:Rhodanese domain-containing protein n=2 Tax=Candidatus Collieribacteriota TaxID=1752725 RepID=A0A2H0DTL7_9BACT|nr:MAG: hypothetical protein COW83_03830 [Candidatus Collierbacteria bacterium CG22_combo_CG10-13_8_21_14_all_43_12]PIZ24713.1 MAG: hypothetical protein COY48_01505 [Candidatus Collierbacteria bacterium CG_4_10_14_0_8_um_filter_43_86]PJB47194.1 MAG: hypothetical protein CO104_04270 [Candidatus Collierbacteria bacterium CG_4_9_14_3_um_filter_43_16]